MLAKGQFAATHRKEDADGKNKHPATRQHLDELLGEGEGSQGLDVQTGEAHTDTRLSSLTSSLS